MPRADQLGELASILTTSVEWIVGRPEGDQVFLLTPRALEIVQRTEKPDRALMALAYLSLEPDENTMVISDEEFWVAHKTAVQHAAAVINGTERPSVPSTEEEAG